MFRTSLTCVGVILMLLECEQVSSQRLLIQPSTVYAGGSSVSGTTVPTTTPEVVTMECTPEGIVGIEGIFSMYIKRDTSSFAEITNIDSIPRLSSTAPSDIRAKAPALEGDINNLNPLSSRLKASFLVSRTDCKDDSIYQCSIVYKPIGYDSTNRSSSMALNVQVLPRDLQLSVSSVDNSVTPVVNQSIIDPGEQLEFSCTGYVGDTQSTLIEWHRRLLPSQFFQRFYPTQSGDSIDDGYPSESNQCEYMRTSKLRYTMSTLDTTVAVYRCEVLSYQASGPQYRVHSQEFHITPGKYARLYSIASHTCGTFVNNENGAICYLYDFWVYPASKVLLNENLNSGHRITNKSTRHFVLKTSVELSVIIAVLFKFA